MPISVEEYIALLEDGRKHNKALGQISALEQAIELLAQISHEYEKSDNHVAEFIASQRMIREVAELKAVISQSHFRN